jgi:hypothetical protein
MLGAVPASICSLRPAPLPEAELVSLLAAVGFSAVKVTDRFDCFRGTSKENVARKFACMA